MTTETDSGRGSEALELELPTHLIGLLETSSLERGWWEERLSELSAVHGDEVYSQILYLLTHIQFSPKEARKHWLALLEEWEVIASALGKAIDLRVVVLYYFLQIQKQLENPTMVEIRIFQKAQASALKDELTDTYNYRYFQDRVRQEFERINRFGKSLSLLMIDVDDFKAFNDRNGHLAGNVALKSIAAALRESVRDLDIVARYGGEEFVVLLPTTPKSGALTVAEKLRLAVADKRIPGEEVLPKGRLTVSVGVGTAPSDAPDVETLIECADAALYEAKARGKNRVEVYSEERREHVRYPARFDGRIRVLDEDTLNVSTVNLSKGGLLVVSKKPYPLGGIVQMELDQPSEEQIIACTGRVVRLEERGGLYEVGINILHVDEDDRYRYRQLIRNLESESTSDDDAAEASAEVRATLKEPTA